MRGGVIEEDDRDSKEDCEDNVDAFTWEGESPSEQSCSW